MAVTRADEERAAQRPRGVGSAGGLTHADALENACEHVAEAPGHRPWVRWDGWPPAEHTYGWECPQCDDKTEDYRQEQS